MEKNIVAHLLQDYDQFTKSEKKIADYVLAHQKETQYISITDLSAACKVAVATISVFCRKLGLSGFNDFKLELARADSGQGKADLRPVDLSTLAADALLPFDPVFFEQGLMLSSQLAEGINVNGDVGRLKEVLDILLDNARKYTEPPGTVNVRLERWGHHRCRLTVSNPGPPLSAAEQKDIFKRFYRTDPARSRDGSFGLGLSIAQRITEEHHGRIWVESSGGYNRFTVELPAR